MADAATGAHGGGGHAVIVADGTGASAVEAEAEAEVTSAAEPEGFSGAMTGGSPSHARRDATGGPTAARNTRLRIRFMFISGQ
jgi:hypothetical protein